jgi:pimeloyl-ACP methyl ester carboxylesterase
MADAFSNRHAVEVHGYTIHVRKSVTHKALSVLLIHGLGTSSDSFIRYARLLSLTYNVYCIDLPGYGKTPKPANTLLLEDMAKLINEYVRSSIQAPCILIGHSMGCQIVVHSITTTPQLFEKAVLLSPTINMYERSVFKQSLRLTQDVLIESPPSNFVVFTNYIRMGVLRYAKTLQFMLDDPIEERLTDNSIPLLIVRGSKDRVVARKWTHYLHSVTPHAQHKEIAGAPHLVQYIKAKELTRVTNEFIKR